MNAGDFRRIALSLEGVEESSHMGSPDFRVQGKIFATLASQHLGYGKNKNRREKDKEETHPPHALMNFCLQTHFFLKRGSCSRYFRNLPLNA
jgi:hypothetical protein